MKHERQISDRTRFWIGVIACIMVGAIASTVSYFSSAHIFNNGYKMHNIFIRVYDVIDTNKSVGLWGSKDNHINSDLVIKNTGELPVLLRIKYTLYRKNDENSEWWVPGVSDQNRSWRHNLSYMFGSTEIKVQNEDKFLFNGETESIDDTNTNYDGYYYYQGILEPDNIIQHLDEIYQKSNEYVSIRKSYYKGSNIDKREGWVDNDLGLGKMLHAVNSFGPVIYGMKKGPIESIRATVEAIQATDKEGKKLTEKKDHISTLTALELHDLWKKLTSTTT